ncbi:MAG TPA: VOC family protein [bacterium]|nr:VOC family protein [bacterium]
MTTRTEYAHGEFSWTNLGTIDAAAAKRFYGSLFGWEYDDIPAGPEMTYTMCRLKNHYAAGLYVLDKNMQSQGVPSHWLSFINVRDADDVAKKASQAGGKVLMGPIDVLGAGRSAALHDPTGARIAIWQAKKHTGAGVINEPGAMCWNELMTPDVTAAREFYSVVFGWTAELLDIGEDSTYTIFTAGGTQVGGMMARPPQLKDVPPHWLTYFAVADCDGAAKRVGELGGQVLRPPADVPNTGRFAVCRDAQGAVFAVFKPQNA